MQELIKITEKEGQQLVSARELHEFLGVTKHITQWIKPYIKDDNDYGFELNVDFMRIDGEVNPTNGLPTVDFAITIEMAKELSMVSKTEKGKQARKYFIQCEKKLKEVVQAPKQLTAIEQLKLQNEAILEVDKKVNEVIEEVEDLKNNTTISYGQQEVINRTAKEVVVHVLGGKDAPAYKELNKKVFSSFWKDYKRVMQVASYRDTLVKDYDKALDFIIAWHPNRDLELMIIGCNSQINFKEDM